MKPTNRLFARALLPLALTAAGLLVPFTSAAPSSHPLRVSGDGRHLVQADGRPFFYLADTAWSLFHRLTFEEADLYLRNRAAKGFTVVQAVALSELDGLRTPNAYGERPLLENDPRRPNERYFARVDRVVDRAGELGLTVALLPTWGDKWHSRQNEPGPRVFRDAATARDFARFIGRRYGSRPVMFVLGGDRNVETDEDLALTRAFAEGLKEAAPKTLVTYHPRGPGRSSDKLHREAWLDFDMIQSSHTGRGSDNGANVEHDRALEPPKPTLDGETRYEAIAVDFYMRGANPAVRFDDSDVRMAAYRALLAGAAGHTYGNNNIWQMWAPGREPVLGADTPWSEAIDHPGAFQMGHLRRLFESRPWPLLEPDQALLVGPNPPGAGFVRAAVAKDRSFAFVYSPLGEPVSVDQSRLGARDLTAWWFDPRYGRAYFVHTGVGTANQVFTPPSSGRGCDWVLVLDDAARGFPPPGEAKR
ncbi:MAG TPA: glycoside hydrolase family 140 protein [Vicinamibacteria bacterium]|nr:glycoside hydrolase family 140 protein [Vicinamibacteria bacterium]